MIKDDIIHKYLKRTWKGEIDVYQNTFYVGNMINKDCTNGVLEELAETGKLIMAQLKIRFTRPWSNTRWLQDRNSF